MKTINEKIFRKLWNKFTNKEKDNWDYIDFREWIVKIVLFFMIILIFALGAFISIIIVQALSCN